MKTKIVLMSIVLLVNFLTGCVGNISDISTEAVGGFDFSEDEVVEPPSTAGIDFSDDEGLVVDGEAGFDFSEEDADGAEGMAFTEEEAVDISVERQEVYPPEGTSNWLFDHDEVVMTCFGNATTISDAESEMLQITLGAEGASLVISELYADNQVFYSLDYANENAAQYYGFASFEGIGHNYLIQFVSLENTMIADFLIGSLKADSEGCVITREFSAYLVDVE